MANLLELEPNLANEILPGDNDELKEVAASGGLKSLELMFQFLVEATASLIVLIEVVVLGAGVVSRYVFHKPITWTDELATTLFLWLAMFGSVIALQRGEHLRLTAVANMARPRWREKLAALSSMSTILFLGVIVFISSEHVEDHWDVMTAALGMRDGIRVSAIPIGAALMLIIATIQMFRRTSIQDIVLCGIILSICAFVLWWNAAAIQEMGNLNLLIFFVAILSICIAAAAPIAVAFGLSTVAYLTFVTTTPLTIVIGRMDEGMSELILLAVPLFVFLGLLIEMTGMAKALIDFMSSMLAHVKGGLSYVLLGAMYLVSGISGSKVADMAAVAPVLFPEMKRRGSKPGELVALLASAGAMSETIPPSIVLLTVGSVVGISMAALFTGGLMPAAIAAIALVFVTYLRSRGDNVTGVQRASKRQILRLFVISVPALILPFLIRTAVVEGIATATEVSTVGIVYSVVVGIVVYRRFDWRRVYPMLVATASLSGAILLIIGTATGMAWALTQSGFSQQLVAQMTSIPGGRFGFLAISILVFMVLGSVLEGIPAIVLFGPLLFPAARALGIHDVQYAMVAILAMGIGLFAPPFGIGFFAASMIGGASPDEAMGRIWPYLAAVLAATILVAAIPWLSIGFL